MRLCILKGPVWFFPVLEFPYEDFLCHRNCCKYFGPEGVKQKSVYELCNYQSPATDNRLYSETSSLSLSMRGLRQCFVWFGRRRLILSRTLWERRMVQVPFIWTWVMRNGSTTKDGLICLKATGHFS